MESVIYPTVHLNGTSRDELMDQLENAAHAVCDALVALSRAEPNARDYYPQGDAAWLRAVAAHGKRVASLVAVRDELMALYEKISEG